MDFRSALLQQFSMSYIQPNHLLSMLIKQNVSLCLRSPHTAIPISSHTIIKAPEETGEYVVNWLLGASVFRSVFGQ